MRGHGIDFNSLLVMAGVIGFGGSFISLLMSKWMAKRATGAHVIEVPANTTERWLFDTVQRQAQRAGIGMPEVAIYDAPEINAFATGWNKNASLVAVSTGLLENMSQDEAEAVLGHEVSHVANGDMVTLALMQGVVNTFVIFLSRVIGVLVDRLVFKVERGHGPAFWVTTIVAQLVLGVLATHGGDVVQPLSRVPRGCRRRQSRRPAQDDRRAGAAPQQYGQPPQLPDQVKAFGISGTTGLGLKRLFMSHPPLEERIAALRAAPDVAPSPNPLPAHGERELFSRFGGVTPPPLLHSFTG